MTFSDKMLALPASEAQALRSQITMNIVSTFDAGNPATPSQLRAAFLTDETAPRYPHTIWSIKVPGPESAVIPQFGRITARPIVDRG